MAYGLLDAAVEERDLEDTLIYGVTTARVISNADLDGQGRVQLSLPWADIQPWARVAVPMGGKDRGTFFIPQEDDEVLVVFNQGDIREPFVIGSLWSDGDTPPATKRGDPVNKRIIRSPKGLEIEFDDAAHSITLTIKTMKKGRQSGKSEGTKSNEKQTEKQKDPEAVPIVIINDDEITLKRVASKDQKDEHQVVRLNKDGITLKANKGNISLEATKGDIRLKAKNVDVMSSSQTQIKADGNCIVKGNQVRIN